jgi:PEP-CTERM motif
MKNLLGILASIFILASASVSFAATVSWTDWTNAGLTVTGTLTVGSDTIGVTYSGGYGFAQTAGGTNYWNPATPYLSSAVSNAPPDPDIIALVMGSSTSTITFSEAVHDPLIALVSWNGNVVDFGVPIEILSFGAGFWGNGTPILNAEGDGFSGVGEVHAVIRLPGDYTSITFSHLTENWHGLTVGVVDVAQTPGVPAPASLVLLGLSLVGWAAARRIKRS